MGETRRAGQIILEPRMRADHPPGTSRYEKLSEGPQRANKRGLAPNKEGEGQGYY